MRNPTPQPLPNRRPQEEFLAIDVDGDQQAVVDAAMDGQSLVVHTPPGTGATQTAVALATSLAHTGHRVLYIAQSSDVLDDFEDRMRDAGLPDFVVDGRAHESELRKRLIGLIASAERATRPELGELLKELNKNRDRLEEHADALHRARQPWNASVLETMEKLAELTSGEVSPSTSVRLGVDFMRLSSGERRSLRDDILELSSMGGFTLGAEDSVWLGAAFTSDEDAERSRAVAERSARNIKPLVAAVEPVLREAGLNPPRTTGDWARSLHALSAAKKTLSAFRPGVFTRDLAPLIAATGTGDYRRSHNVDMGLFERNRNKRAARELLREGAHVDDLHAALVEAAAQRDTLREMQGNDSAPALPESLEKATKLSDEVEADLATLAPVLENTPDGGDLPAMLVEEMRARLTALGEDRESLRRMPRRSRLEQRLRDSGLGELVDDLRQRRVRPVLVEQEFELAYWATVLQQMAAEDPQVGGHDGTQLHAVVDAFAVADARYVAAGASRLRFSHANGWKRAIEEHTDEAAIVRSALRSRHLHVDDLSARAPKVLGALGPVWMVSPFQVSEYFVDSQVFDTVILADAARLSVPEALPAIARARQVIALGDDHLLGPREFSVAVDRKVGQRSENQESVFTALSDFLPAYRLHTNHRVTPHALAQLINREFYSSTLQNFPFALANEGSGLEFAFVPEAQGTPDAATGQVESPDAEVRRVVDLVIRHARTRSRQSLAVVTLTPWHAARVATGIAQAIRDYPYVASFFNNKGQEPFVVTDAEQVQGVVRDAVIFSLGYGKTLQGRVVYNFGPLSSSLGKKVLATVLSRARRKLTVVSCFAPDDFELQRLHNGATLLPALLNAAANGVPRRPAAVERDPLVSDIARRLRKHGVAPEENFEGLDLALPLGPSSEDGMGLAVETDGRRYALVPSLRERERLIPSALQRRGWTYVRLWSTDAFVDPQAETDRIYSAWKDTVERRSPQTVLSAARAAAVVVGRQGPRPKMTPGLSLRAHNPADVFAMLDWIQSDGVFRDNAELADQLTETLALKRRGPEASAVTEVVEAYRDRANARKAGERDSSVAPHAGGPSDTAASAVPQNDVMPSYDTETLRHEDIIDAGLRPEDTTDSAGADTGTSAPASAKDSQQGSARGGDSDGA